MNHAADTKEVRKARVLVSIASFHERNGYAPTFRDLGDELGLAHSAVWRTVQLLRADGLIHDSTTNINRSLSLTAAGSAYLGQRVRR